MVSFKIATNIFRRLVREHSAIVYLLVFPILASILAMTMTKETPIRIGIIQETVSLQLKQQLDVDSRYDTIIVIGNEYEEILSQHKLKYMIKGESDGRVMIYSQKKDDKLMELKGVVEALLLGEAIPTPQNNPISDGRMVIGFGTMLILMFTGAITGNILEDRRLKTLMRLYGAPLGRIKISLGYLAGLFLIGSIQVLVFIGITKYVMKIDYGISNLYLILITMAFLLTATGISIGLAGFVRDNEKYSVVCTLITVPTCLLGGSFFPISFLPDNMRIFANFIPQKWFMEVYDQLVLGASINQLLGSLGILLLFGIVFFSFGVKTIHPSLEEI